VAERREPEVLLALPFVKNVRMNVDPFLDYLQVLERALDQWVILGRLSAELSQLEESTPDQSNSLISDLT
jgi:hypothetical protein